MKRINFYVTAGFMFLFVLSVSAQTKSNYEIVNKFHLEGNSKWDFLFSDDETNELYVSHGNIVQVVNQSTGELLGTITGMNGVHGIAIAPDLNKGFITSGKDSSVTIFDTKTFQVIKRITTTGNGPDAILFDSFSKNVFVFNGKSNNATIINAATNEIVSTIKFDGNPECSVSDNKGKVYVNIENKSSIVVINSSTNKIENSWSLLPGEEPTGLAFDNENERLFSVCANKMMTVLDAVTGKVITTLPTGEKSDGAAFDPEKGIVYSSNGDGTLTIIKEQNKDSFKVLENFKTQKGAKTITLNKKTHHIYLPTAQFTEQQDEEKPKVVAGTFIILDIMPH